MDEVVTSRLDKKDIVQIDKFVQLGYYKNRSEAIRQLIAKGIQDLIEQDILGDLEANFESKRQLTDADLLKIGGIIFNKPVEELVAEGRHR